VVRALKSSKGLDIVSAQFSGPGAVGQTLEPNKPVRLDVNFKCLVDGVTPVMITVPMVPYFYGSASFRVTKVCGSFTAHYSFAWTPGRILIAAVGALIVAALFAYCFCNCQPSRSSGQKYGKVATNQPMDAFDEDLEDA
jgi:hypothetical protein